MIDFSEMGSYSTYHKYEECIDSIRIYEDYSIVTITPVAIDTGLRHNEKELEKIKVDLKLKRGGCLEDFYWISYFRELMEEKMIKL